MNIQRLMQRVSTSSGTDVYLLSADTRWLKTEVGLQPVTLHLVDTPEHSRSAQEHLTLAGWTGSHSSGAVKAHRQFPGVLLRLHTGTITTLLAEAAIPEDRCATDQHARFFDQRACHSRQLDLPDDPLWTGQVPRTVHRHDLARSASRNEKMMNLLAEASAPHHRFTLLRTFPYLKALPSE